MHTDRSRWFLLSFGVALPTLLFLISGGGDDPLGAAFASGECTRSDPGDSDYCDSDECGACAEEEGDCDPGECQDGLVCVEEGDVDHCRAAGAAASNLQVKLDGVWRGVCCDGDRLRVTDEDCWWTEEDRTLTDETEGREVDCPEGGPAHCECDGSGERLHGSDGDLDSSVRLPEGGPMYSNYGEETCIVVDDDGELETAWTDSVDCPDFRLQ